MMHSACCVEFRGNSWLEKVEAPTFLRGFERFSLYVLPLMAPAGRIDLQLAVQFTPVCTRKTSKDQMANWPGS